MTTYITVKNQRNDISESTISLRDIFDLKAITSIKTIELTVTGESLSGEKFDVDKLSMNKYSSKTKSNGDSVTYMFEIDYKPKLAEEFLTTILKYDEFARISMDIKLTYSSWGEGTETVKTHVYLSNDYKKKMEEAAETKNRLTSRIEEILSENSKLEKKYNAERNELKSKLSKFEIDNRNLQQISKVQSNDIRNLKRLNQQFSNSLDNYHTNLQNYVSHSNPIRQLDNYRSNPEFTEYYDWIEKDVLNDDSRIKAMRYLEAASGRNYSLAIRALNEELNSYDYAVNSFEYGGSKKKYRDLYDYIEVLLLKYNKYNPLDSDKSPLHTVLLEIKNMKRRPSFEDMDRVMSALIHHINKLKERKKRFETAIYELKNQENRIIKQDLEDKIYKLRQLSNLKIPFVNQEITSLGSNVNYSVLAYHLKDKNTSDNPIRYENAQWQFPENTQTVFIFDATECINLGTGEEVTSYWFDTAKDKKLKAGELYGMSKAYFKQNIVLRDGVGLDKYKRIKVQHNYKLYPSAEKNYVENQLAAEKAPVMDVMGVIASPNMSLSDSDKNGYSIKYFTHTSR